MTVDQRAAVDDQRARELAGWDRPQGRDERGDPYFLDERRDQSGAAPDIRDNDAAMRAAADSRRASLPQTPDAYEAKLPHDFFIPDGIEVRFDPADPLLGEARRAAHRMGLTQQQFSELLAIHASANINQTTALRGAMEAEKAKLGPTHASRIDSVVRFLQATLPADLSRSMINSLWTADNVKAWEAIIQKISSQGAANFSQAGREPTGNGSVSDEDWSRMTKAERFEYSRAASTRNGRR
jgi:hypothetical protein